MVCSQCSSCLIICFLRLFIGSDLQLANSAAAEPKSAEIPVTHVNWRCILLMPLFLLKAAVKLVVL